jgi:putative Ca2+/H+ antiporter (TMEM165/GDT1 family)
MLVVFYPLFYKRKYLDYFYIVFFIAFALSLLTEDTLETQAGVTFYALFNCLFLFAKPAESLD